MRRSRIILLTAMVALFAAGALAADVDGAWTATVQGKEGRTFEMKMTFKAEGEQLTGTMSSMGGEVAIQDGKVSGDKISFTVKRQFQDRSFVMKYEGVVSGDEIKFKQTIEGADRPPREFTAKRAK